VLDRGDEAIADGEAIDLVRPLAGQLHVDSGDDPFALEARDRGTATGVQSADRV
jgi:hypothetical protein